MSTDEDSQSPGSWYQRAEARKLEEPAPDVTYDTVRVIHRLMSDGWRWYWDRSAPDGTLLCKAVKHYEDRREAIQAAVTINGGSYHLVAEPE